MARNKRLYRTLGVRRDATPQEIKRAYHRLAQQYHPDKGGGRDSAEVFKRVQAAYDVLKDADKRSLYDRFGDAGLQAADDNEVAFMALATYTEPAVVVCTAFTTLLVFFILLALRVDGMIAWSWLATLTPLWVFDSILMIPLLAMPCGICEDAPSCTTVLLRVAMMLRVAAVVAFTVLVGLKLDGYVAYRWVDVFAPLYVCVVAGVPGTLAACGRASYEEVCALLGEPPDAPAFPYNRYVLSKVLTALRNLAFVPLLALRLDHVYEVSYYLVTLPILIQAGVHLTLFVHDSWVLHRGDGEGCGGVVRDICYLAVACGLFISQYVLLMNRLDGSGTPMVEVLVPVWIGLGLMACVSCCVALCCAFGGDFTGDNDDDDDDDDSTNGAAAGDVEAPSSETQPLTQAAGSAGYYNTGTPQGAYTTPPGRSYNGSTHVISPSRGAAVTEDVDEID